MKKAVLTSIATLAMSATAFAADLPVRGPAIAPAPVFVGMTWTGFYVGIHGGWSDIRERQAMSSPAFALTVANSASGGLAGLHAGYNFQSGSMVYGIEADIAYIL